MPNPLWPRNRNKVPIKRDTGYRDEGATQSFVETMRRPEEVVAAALAKAPAPVVLAPAAAQPATPATPVTPAPPAPIVPDRFHKWGHYVIVGRDHNPGDDPVIPPGYAKPSGAGFAASSIADGYAKAASIAAQDGRRCPLIILGGGAPWKESLALTSGGVDLIGWAKPTLLGNVTHPPTLADFYAEGVRFSSPNELPGYWMPATQPDFRYRPDAGVRFKDCEFTGPLRAFYAQRRFSGTGCTFWLNKPVPTGSELAACVVEQEDQQSGFSILHASRFYTYIPDGQSPTLLPDPYIGPRINAPGFAIRASARRGVGLPGNTDGAAWVQNLYSSDGIFRPQVTPDTGVGVYTSGLLLDDCYVEGALLCEGWTVCHSHGRQYGGVNIGNPENTAAYAIIRGHDWMGGDGFLGRQFGVVMFDLTQTHVRFVAIGEPDPLAVDPAYQGGQAVFYRHSEHLIDFGAGAQAIVSLGGVMYVYDTCATTHCAHLYGGQPPGPGSQFGIDATTAFHPFNSRT